MISKSSKAFRTICLASFIVAGMAGMTISAPANAQDMKGWQKKLVSQIRKKQTYPRAALSREIEGKAKVKVTIDKGGNILNYEIVQPTGKSVLDKEVPRLMERLNPMPALPDGYAKDTLTFTLPISWRLG